MSELTAVFDDLLKIPGMRPGMRINTLPKAMEMKYDEVVYLLQLPTTLTLPSKKFYTILNIPKTSGTSFCVEK